MRVRMVAALLAGLGLVVGPALVPGTSARAAGTFDDVFAVSVASGLDFGDVPFGSAPRTQSYRFTALRDGARLAASGWVAPAPDTWFTEVAAGACTGFNAGPGTFVTMKAGEVCTVTVTLDPNVALAPDAWVQATRWYSAQIGEDPYGTRAFGYGANVHSLDIAPLALQFQAPLLTPAPAQTITLTNTAVVPLSPIAVVDGYDPIAPFTVESDGCTAVLAPGASCQVTFGFTGQDNGVDVAGGAGVRYSADGPTGSRGYDARRTLVTLLGQTLDPATTVDIRIGKTPAAGPFVAGDPVDWTITISNDGPADAPDILFIEYPGDGLVYESSTAPGCDENRDLPGAQAGVTVELRWAYCRLGPLAAGASITFTARSTIAAAVAPGTTLTNVVEAYSPLTDPDYGTNSATATVGPTRPLAGLRLTKAASVTQSAVGGSVDWTLTVTNDGPDDAEAATVTDILPAGVALASTPPGCTAAGSTLTCDLGTLAPDDTARIIVPTLLRDSALAGTTVTNTATAATTSVSRYPEAATAQAAVAVAATAPTAGGTTGATTELAESGSAPAPLALLGGLLLAAGTAIGVLRRRDARTEE